MQTNIKLVLLGLINFLLFSTLTIALDLDNNTSLVVNDTSSKLQIVNDMYSSFATGDIPAVLADMDTNIEWNESENFPYVDAVAAMKKASGLKLEQPKG